MNLSLAHLLYDKPSRDLSEKDYYPFGMVMPERDFQPLDLYRFGFNGKESDNEIKGNGNSYDYGFRIYDSRIARFLSVDPLFKSYPWYTPYQFSGNKPIRFIDLDGLEDDDAFKYIVRDRTVLYLNNDENIIAYSPYVMWNDAVNGLDNLVIKGIWYFISNESKVNMVRKVAGENGYDLSLYTDMEILDNFDVVFQNREPVLRSTQEGGELLSLLVDLLDFAAIAPIGGSKQLTTPLIADAKPIIAKAIKSIVKQDDKLLDLAKETFKGNSRLQDEANALIKQLKEGNTNPGIGTKFVPGTKGIYEARSRNGARVYFRNVHTGIEIVGYSNKDTQTRVINRLTQLYPKNEHRYYMNFTVNYPTGYNVINIYNDNIDINIILEDGRIFFATFFTVNNIIYLMDNETNSFRRDHFWATDMVIVRDLSVATIEQTINYILNTCDICEVFSLINNK